METAVPASGRRDPDLFLLYLSGKTIQHKIGWHSLSSLAELAQIQGGRMICQWNRF
jgi:hypothetical protein